MTAPRIARCLAALGVFACAPATNSPLSVESDGVRLWVASAGRSSEVPLLFLHGGPGDHSEVFRQSVGARLESDRTVLYLDQRGGGRSDLVDEAFLGFDAFVTDIEAVRRSVRADRLDLLGHSFGAYLAMHYADRYPERVRRIVAVDMAPSWRALLSHQAAHLAALVPAPQRPPPGATPMARLAALYDVLGRDRAQAAIQFRDKAAFDRFRRASQATGLRGRSRGRALTRMRADGLFERDEWDLRPPPAVRTLLLAGRHSEVVGERLLARTATVWRAKLEWLKESGHFPFFDEPEAFATRVRAFLNAP